MNNALRIIHQTPSSLVVANHVIQFGRNGFTKATALESSFTGARLYVTLPGAAGPVGFADWKTAKRDEKGLFLARVLSRRNKYVAWLEELIKAGLVTTEPEAVEGEIKGRADKWTAYPIKADQLIVASTGKAAGDFFRRFPDLKQRRRAMAQAEALKLGIEIAETEAKMKQVTQGIAQANAEIFLLELLGGVK